MLPGFFETLIMILMFAVSIGLPVAMLIGIVLVYRKVSNIERMIASHLSSHEKHSL